MRLSRVEIRNFRNFKHLDVALSDHVVVVGENKIGKSNLLYALRLVLDPSLPESARRLRAEDFWDGLARPLKRTERISIAVELTDFEGNDNHFALLGEHLIETDPITARLTYVYQPKADLKADPSSEADYEFFVFGADREEDTVGYEIRRDLPFDLLPALRDAEGDIANWRRSPLRPLLDAVAAAIDRGELLELAQKISEATRAVAAADKVDDLVDTINSRLVTMVGERNAVTTTLGFSPTDPDRLLRSMRLFVDGTARELSTASLGSANLLYLTLKALELERLVADGQRHHTFLGIEEPEAHLHPHLQRLVYRDFLRMPADISILLTTHSPHIVSVSPLRSLVLLKQSGDSSGDSVASSAATLGLDDATVADLERYLDVTRGEMLFAKAVILVEGEAERFLIPALARGRGMDFDKLGVSVCAVGGTHFEAYAKFLGRQGLDIPFAVVTDGDPDSNGKRLGQERIIRLVKAVAIGAKIKTLAAEKLLEVATKRGLCCGDDTIEVDLFRAGAHRQIADVLSELAKGRQMQERAAIWRTTPSRMDPKRLVKDIERIGKGRFAQRLAGRLGKDVCPGYITTAIDYVRSRVS